MKLQIEKGQSMLEILMALAVMALIVMAIVGLATISIRNSSYSKNKSLAEKFATETVDWLRQERDSGWTVFAAKAVGNGTYCLPQLAWLPAPVGECSAGQYVVGTVLQRQIILQTNDGNIEAEVLVFWTDSQGEHRVKLNSFFSNWKSGNE